jgi:hypothetical protein
MSSVYKEEAANEIPGPWDKERATFFKKFPLAAAGLASRTARISALAFSSRAASEKESFPHGA